MKKVREIEEGREADVMSRSPMAMTFFSFFFFSKI